MGYRLSLTIAGLAALAGAASAPACAQYSVGATQYAPPPPNYVVPAEGTVPPGYGAQVYAPSYGYGAPPPAYPPPANYGPPQGYAPPAAAQGMMSPAQARSIALNLGYDQVGRAVLSGRTYMMTANADSGPILLGVDAFNGRLRPLGPAYAPPGMSGPPVGPPPVAARPSARPPVPAARPPEAGLGDPDDEDIAAAPPPAALPQAAISPNTAITPDAAAPPPAAVPPPQPPASPPASPQVTGAGHLTPGDNVSAGTASVLSRGTQ